MTTADEFNRRLAAGDSPADAIGKSLRTIHSGAIPRCPACASVWRGHQCPGQSGKAGPPPLAPDSSIVRVIPT